MEIKQKLNSIVNLQKEILALQEKALDKFLDFSQGQLVTTPDGLTGKLPIQEHLNSNKILDDIFKRFDKIEKNQKMLTGRDFKE